jgi:multiple sugar transport system permease protein
MSLFWSGTNMVIFLAGLQSVPRHLYDAAAIDGAGLAQRFWSITLPMLSPTILFTAVIGVIGALQVFTQAFVMTTGGPLDSTLFYVLYLYQNAFQYLRMGYASALAWVLFFLAIICTVAILRLSRDRVYYEFEGRP